jgi:hypothetical protein
VLWAPPPWLPPDHVAGSLFTIVLLLSEIPNSMIKKAAESYDVASVRTLLPVMVAIGVLLLVIRGFEFNSLNVMWYDNAYGSIIWALLLLHTTHILTDWVDTVVLWMLMRTRVAYEGREYVYSVEDLGMTGVLEREGVRVSIEPGRYVPPATRFTAGTATGPADAVDLAIAIVLEEVDTDVLTLGGAALSSPLALMQYFSDRAE